MGCSGSNKVEEIIEMLKENKRNVERQIESNEMKIEDYKLEIDDFDQKINKIDKDVRFNRNQYNDYALRKKAEQIAELIKGRNRVQRKLDNIKANNELMENNLENIDKKIDDITNLQQAKNNNKLLGKYNNLNNRILEENGYNINTQKRIDDANLKKKQQLNEQYAGKDAPNVDDILNKWRGNGNGNLMYNYYN